MPDSIDRLSSGGRIRTCDLRVMSLAYRQDMQLRGVKPHSLVTYDRVLRLWAEYLGNQEASRVHVQSFLLSTGWAVTTQRTALAYLRACYEFAVDELEMIDRNPCKRVRLPKREQRIIRTISNRRLREIKADLRDYDDSLTFALFAYTGMRTIEVRRLTWADVDFEENMLTVHGKGDRWRLVPIHFRLRPLLLEGRERGLDGFLRPGRGGYMISVGGLHYNAKRIAPDVQCHDYRRTVATSLRANRCDPYVRDAIMGWTRDEMFAAHYNHVSPTELQEGMLCLYRDDPV